MKKQVVVIHGGDTFETYEKYLDFLCNYEIDSLDYFKHKGWKSILQEKLGDDFEVIRPQMPNKINAKYLEWRIWFEKLVPLLNPEVILVGHSMGGIFLAKYLSENNFPKKILGTFLVSAPYDAETFEYTLVDFVLPADLKKFEEQGGKIYLYHSTDDDVVPFDNLEKYKKQLPSATARVFEDRGHFNQEDFPELVQDILNIAN
ncbi:MAG: hypothetical protein UT65_C0018G0007 [Parcubacteria group bacterium GW2011_GWF2_39_8b]|uniref:AB hydrolase-1 domain-containing protein n=1 Tax=Candidatus Zambryskibacteria bacterium RIFCSPHIGHO2_02_38_10.5 TaxID=1802742 RepID=A0A1G2T8K8_9BACT|nr:MAG: hypothetical protein UT65_C0018G0007 [Parcubacteria group bacterium GW2011_GWF2_39_8b]KKR45552.1 MAG: hypothetical protein UT81_C0011G0016 [Parcubacteria group bacterium GW2011_GWA2_40_14]OHA93616.1 MAG: hypothetical protein A2W58_01675 [Candidatus Zambryskibacteria bacterium RIFCSPHIGHO2_02_38_10.5]OHA96251.1 MAG: hypothetical protein A3C63_02420 [Candidatus Zambryskibacteria bacterium RIFCSPHIGHO2_02_FULL_39_82]OHB08817.1 MAG: hypothetical protein A2W64_02775 [Candidatus Zambryskibact